MNAKCKCINFVWINVHIIYLSNAIFMVVVFFLAIATQNKWLKCYKLFALWQQIKF